MPKTEHYKVIFLISLLHVQFHFPDVQFLQNSFLSCDLFPRCAWVKKLTASVPQSVSKELNRIKKSFHCDSCGRYSLYSRDVKYVHIQHIQLLFIGHFSNFLLCFYYNTNMYCTNHHSSFTISLIHKLSLCYLLFLFLFLFNQTPFTQRYVSFYTIYYVENIKI